MEHLHFLLLCLQIYLCCFMSSVDGHGASTDRAALLSFKNAVVSDPHGALRSWIQNTSHCTWYGVSCSKEGARVRSLNLSSLGLVGPISSQLSNLSSLSVLDLYKNSFHGEIPLPLSRCHNLKAIRLHINNLTGDVPSGLGSLQRLEELNFANNRLTGVIPATLGNLTSLKILSLVGNQLVGEIPSELGRLQNLQWIQLSNNQLSGEIPRSIFNVSSLVFLSLANNKLTGTLPRDLDLVSALPNLMWLYLAQNRITGRLSTFLFNASRIQELDLSLNGFQGPVPMPGRLKDLTYLNLGHNSLSSTTELNLQLIDSLGNCTQLQILKIHSNHLSGKFPSSVANLSAHLQDFCFANNWLTGSFPKGFEKFQDLMSLSIENNYLTGAIPESLGSLKKLQRFSAFDNKFSGEIPDIFDNLTQLSDLLIGGNQFFGRIPTSIGSCQQLNRLHIAKNRLNGVIPKEIYELSTLFELYLHQNNLSGPLPAEVSNLKHIQYMSFSVNALSGNIPATIGSCSSLENLYMSQNNFTGSIPSSIGKLASLGTLDLSSNSLTGKIPQELEKLQYLLRLNLSLNHLDGEVPANGIFLKLSQDSLMGNSKLCSSNHKIAESLGLTQCNAKRRNKNTRLKFVLPVVIVANLVIVSCILCALRSKKKEKAKVIELRMSKALPPMISYSDIRLATDNFSANNLIGKGGYGCVYKGVFINFEDESNNRGTLLAVKVLDLQHRKAARSFEAECEILRNIRHRNLVKVITSCSSIEHTGEEFKALVMEFMPHGNLDKWLYEEAGDGLCLTLLQRLNIAIDVASAMDYLHHDCDPPIVHCDLKPANVLLDDDMVAHVSDFGLARFVSQNSSGNGTSTIGVKGSIGYIAPEYGLGGNASTSGDVYSFGILLLEMFIAKKPTNEIFKEGLSLIKFAGAVDQKHVMEIADPRLFKNINDGHCSTIDDHEINSRSSNRNNTSQSNLVHKGEEFIAAAIRVGASSAADSANNRLTMRQALIQLQKIKKDALKNIVEIGM